MIKTTSFAPKKLFLQLTYTRVRVFTLFPHKLLFLPTMDLLLSPWLLLMLISTATMCAHTYTQPHNPTSMLILDKKRDQFEGGRISRDKQRLFSVSSLQVDVRFRVKSHPHWITCKAGDAESLGRAAIAHLHTRRHGARLSQLAGAFKRCCQHNASQWLYLQSIPVLAVLAVVIVSAVAGVSVRGAGLPVALSLVLTWV